MPIDVVEMPIDAWKMQNSKKIDPCKMLSITSFFTLLAFISLTSPFHIVTLLWYAQGIKLHHMRTTCNIVKGYACDVVKGYAGFPSRSW